MTDPSASSVAICDTESDYAPTHRRGHSCVTATGAQLANRLRLVGSALEAEEIPRCLGQLLAKAVDKLEAGLARRSALAQLQALLDPHQAQSAWWLACEIATRLQTFQDA